MNCQSNNKTFTGPKQIPIYICQLKKLEERQKQTELSLRLEKERFQSFMQYLPGVAYIKDHRGRYVYLNKTFEDTFSVKLQDWSGKTDKELKYFPNEIIERLIQNDRSVISEKYPLKTTEDVPVDGRIHNWLTVKFPISGKDQERNFIAGAAIDITDRIHIENALKDSEKRYRSMMEAITDPISICSCDGKIIYLNPGMIHRLGHDGTGDICHKALHNLDEKCEWCNFDKIYKGEQIEVTIKSPLDNKTFRMIDMPVIIDDQISKMTIYRDITDYLNAVSEKEQAQAKLQQAQKMESIGNLAGGIAHDFNNILSSILGFTELALDAVDKENPIKGDLQEVYNAGLRAKKLVSQILTFARQSEEEMKPIQVDYIIKEVLKFIRASTPTTVDIKQHINSDSFIMGSATQVHQIMMNLCTNGAHAMENDGGILEITLRDITINRDSDKKGLKFENYLEIKVSDTGTGIEPHITERIFEPYFTTKSSGEGTGMGLALVHGIVDSLGGKIFVESELGKGTVFTIYLPICKSSKTNLIDLSEDLPTGQERILFVDDEVSITKIGSRILGQLGYSVTTTTNSIEALELFQKNPNDFDLVISDVTMPGMAGDNLVTKLMQIRPDIPVILSTGYSKKLSERKALEIGAKALTAKPIVKTDLAKITRKVLDDAKA